MQEGYNYKVPVYLIYRGPEPDSLHTTTKGRRNGKPRRRGHSRVGSNVSLLPLMQTSRFLRDQAKTLYRSTTYHLVSLDHLEIYRKSPFCEPGPRYPRCGVYMDSWHHGKNKARVDPLFAFQQWHEKLVLVNPTEERISHSCVRTQLITQLVGLRDQPWMGALLQGAKKLVSAIEVDRFGGIYLVPQREDLAAATSLYDHNIHDFLRLIAPFATYFRSSVYVCVLDKPTGTPTPNRRIKIKNPTHQRWVKSFESGYISSTQYTDGELILLPKQRFQDECKSFADLEINLDLLRKMTDARLWLRIMDPEYEPSLQWIRRICTSRKIEDTSVKWAQNWEEVSWVFRLSEGERISPRTEGNPRMRGIWRSRGNMVD